VDTETVSLFLALLAVVAQVATLAVVGLEVGGRFSPLLAELRAQAVEAVAPSALTLAFLVAAVCTAGSLYFSEVAHFPPCHLCWLQRFSMYPLVPILGFAAFLGGSRRRYQGDTPCPPGRQEARIRPFAAALAAIGGLIATYHVLLERNPQWESSVCDPKNPCTLIWVERLGYLTIPTMALSGFALILTLLAISRAGNRLDPSELPPGDGGCPPDNGGVSRLRKSEVHGHK
jgi:disulfide bond formation protein DsbB